jgi:hypothetical protein
MLEGCWGIGQAKRHDLVLILAIRGNEGSLPNIFWLDPNQVEGGAEIKTREDLSRVGSSKDIIR